MSEVLSLPFDQYQRYRLVADLVGAVRGPRPLAVLDVGGRTGILRAFLPDDRVFLVDVEPSDEPGLVLGDGAHLPFGDGAFDLVAAFDTLEHVPPAGREAFVAECRRVARHWVMIAGPYRAPRVDEAEELLSAFLKDKLGLEHRYLAEHRSYGLPDREATERQLEAAGGRVASFGHADLDRWLFLMCLELYLDHDPGLRPLAARFFRFYNETLYASDHGTENYRHAVVAALGDAVLPTEVPGLRAPGAPPEAVPRIGELALELLAFDREGEVWRPELERLKGIIADVEKDLVEHKERLLETEANLAEHATTIDELRATYERALADHAAVLAALEADLAGHAAALAESRAAHERALADREVEKTAFEKDLAGHKAELARLEGELRDRWRNLRRAFGPKPE